MSANPEQDYLLFNAIIKMLGMHSHPRDIIKRLSRFYKTETVLYNSDLRIKRLVDSLDKVVEEWDIPLGNPSIRKIDLTDEEKAFVAQNKIIAAIKLVRQRTGLNLRDSKIIIDNYRFGR